MAAARIAAVFLAAILAFSGAQLSSQTQVTVEVTDTTGGVVPGAQVTATSSSICVSTSGKTDDHGALRLPLSPGSYRLFVASPGFCPEKKTVEVFREQADTIPISLTVGGCPSKCTPLCVTLIQPVEPESGRLSIYVTDRTGADIPGACIEVDSRGPAPESALKTDSQGQASLELPAGRYTISVHAKGFEKWAQPIDIQSAATQTITATMGLEILGCRLVVASFSPDIPLESPALVFLPPQPVGNLAPLRSHRSRKRW